MKFTIYSNSQDSLPIPEWITTERYMYCENFVNDYTHTGHNGFLSFVKRLLHI